MTTAAPQLDEEAFVKSIVDGLTMPPGVQFDRVEQSLDWQGNPALRIYFSISTSAPLTKKRISALNQLANAVEDGVINSAIEKFPYIEIVEVK
jgi:hypothetical protein